MRLLYIEDWQPSPDPAICSFAAGARGRPATRARSDRASLSTRRRVEIRHLPGRRESPRIRRHGRIRRCVEDPSGRSVNAVMTATYLARFDKRSSPPRWSERTSCQGATRCPDPRWGMGSRPGPPSEDAAGVRAMGLAHGLAGSVRSSVHRTQCGAVPVQARTRWPGVSRA